MRSLLIIFFGFSLPAQVYAQNELNKVVIIYYTLSNSPQYDKKGNRTGIVYNQNQDMLTLQIKNGEINDAEVFTFREKAKRLPNDSIKIFFTKKKTKKVKIVNNKALVAVTDILLHPKNLQVRRDSVPFGEDSVTYLKTLIDTVDVSGLTIENFNLREDISFEIETTIRKRNKSRKEFFYVPDGDIKRITKAYSSGDSIQCYINTLDDPNGYISNRFEDYFGIRLISGIDTTDFYQKKIERHSVGWDKANFSVVISNPKINRYLAAILPKEFLLRKQIAEDVELNYFIDNYVSWIYNRKK